MYCRYCGKSIEDKAEVCVHCGRRLRNSLISFFEKSEFTKLMPINESKNPNLAAFLGFVLAWFFLGPLGYLYLGQWRWFWLTVIALLIFGFVALFPLMAFFPLSLVFICLFYSPFPFIFALHQYQIAKELNAMLSAKDEDTAQQA